MFTFHHHTIGHLHVLRRIECEDRSFSCSNEEKKQYIAVVADGHGATECFRSGLGAQFAVDITVKHFKEFAEDPNIDEDKLCEDKEYRKEKIKNLTNRIVTDWHNSVIEHFKNNPTLTEKEKDILKDTNIENLINTEKNYPHIYGTTLIAGLMLSKSLILIQQGDGRCDVFYEKDGITKVRQPIPWDPNCEFNVTTSLCDPDAIEKIRVSFVNLNKVKVIACYFGSDGVEDAYRDTYEDIGGSHSLMGGVHTFYKKLSCELVERGKDNFKDYLIEMLPKFSKKGMFSRTGSGDDVSVAGIVNIEELSKNLPHFKKDIEIYDLEEQLFWKKEELKGKSRKHGILTKRCEEAQQKYFYAKNEADKVDKNVNLLFFLKKDKERKENLYDATYKLREAITNFEEYDKTYKKIEKEIKEIEQNIQKVKDPNYLPQSYEVANYKDCSKYEQHIKELTDEVASLKTKIKELEVKMQEAEKRAEEEARLKAEEEARLKAEEEARLKAEEEAIQKAEEKEEIKEEVQLGNIPDKPESVEPGQEKTERGEPKTGEPEQEETEEGEPKTGEPEQGEPEQKKLEQEEPEQGKSEQGEPEQKKLEQEESEQGETEQEETECESCHIYYRSYTSIKVENPIED